MYLSQTLVTGTKGILSSRQPFIEENLCDVYDARRLLEPLIMNDMRRIAQTLNTDFACVEQSNRSVSNINNEFLRDRSKNVREHAMDSNIAIKSDELLFREIRVLAGFIEICEHNDIPTKAKETMDLLEKEGYIIGAIKNYYANPIQPTQYQGLRIDVISPYGEEFALDVHSNESFEAECKGNELIHKMKTVVTGSNSMGRLQKLLPEPISPVTKPQEVENEKNLLLTEIQEVHSSVTKPQGIDNIRDMRIDNETRVSLINNLRGNVHVETHYATETICQSVMVYSIYMKGEEIFNGYEIIHSDGSARLYQNDILHQHTAEVSVDASGLIINQHVTKPHRYSMEETLKIAEDAENANQTWLKEHPYPHY